MGDHQGFYNGKDHQFVLKDGFFKYYTVNSNDFLDASVEESFRASREPDKSGAYFKSEILERISYPVGGMLYLIMKHIKLIGICLDESEDYDRKLSTSKFDISGRN